MDFVDHQPINHHLKKYYQFQSKIYDATRWAFLFGRKRLIDNCPCFEDKALNIMEIGCGTGYNLLQLRKKFPSSKIFAVELSTDMAQIAKNKVIHDSHTMIIEGSYHASLIDIKMDVLVFSYMLSMTDTHYKALIQEAKQQLKPGGIIAIVDFNHSSVNLFKKHMKNNHVTMDGNLTPFLVHKFPNQELRIHKAYFGLWTYFTFYGINN